MTEATEPAAEEAEKLPRETRWAMRVAIGAMALTLIPYLFGWSLQGADASRAWYSWLGYNLDDSCVYLSWMRQAADGHFFQRNLFTTQEQVGHQFNVFTLLLGTIARFTHLPLLVVYHASRLLFGLAFLRASWWLIELLVKNPGARKAGFLLLCFSAGLGWLPGQWHYYGHGSPSDVWQPEAITFLSLYQSPLFLVSLLLMVGVIGWLVVAERTGKMRYAAYAGLCGLLLGNIHTYDVITLMAVWGGYLVLRTISERKLDRLAWSQAVVAGLLTGISTGYMYYLLKTEEVFRTRVAVPTLSPPITVYLLTYAPLMVLGVLGVRAYRRRTNKPGDEIAYDCRGFTLLVVWAVMNLVVAYLPVSFNRKMLMGEHIPLAILAGIGLYSLRAGLARTWPVWAGLAAVLSVGFALMRFPAVAVAGMVPAAVVVIAAALAYRSKQPEWAGVVGVVGLLGLTNLHFCARDMNNFQMNRSQGLIHRPYLYAGEVRALEWLRVNAPAGAPIQPLPWVQRSDGSLGTVDTTVACFAPGLTGHPVHAGHWGETPDWDSARKAWVRFLLPTTPDSDRIAFLTRTGVRYVLFTQKHDEGIGNPGDPQILSVFRQSPPLYLKLIPEASNEDADVYEVVLPQ